MNLLSPRELVRTGPVDHADWNYRPLLGYLSRRRFALIDALLPARQAGRLLEVGYGSGVFLPHLASRASELYGVDIHTETQAVTAALARRGIPATLRTASAQALPFADAFFDAIVAVSALEFVGDIAAGAREMRRVLQPGGALVCVMPAQSPLLDAALRVATGESAEKDYGDRRSLVLPALLREFTIDAERRFPPLLATVLPVYAAYRLRPRSTSV